VKVALLIAQLCVSDFHDLRQSRTQIRTFNISVTMMKNNHDLGTQNKVPDKKCRHPNAVLYAYLYINR